MKIETTEDLLNFLEIENLTPEDAQAVVNDFLGTITVFQLSLDELKRTTRHYIETFGFVADRPIFLQQKSKVFSVKDMVSVVN